jgi:hypothetical protein
MATITSFKRRLDVFKFADTAEQAMIKVEDDFVEENKKQLFEGFNKAGNNLKTYASADYAFYKYSRNPGPGLGNPDLYDTGAFYQGIQAIVSSGTISIGSTDPKEPELLAKYPGIFGLGGKFKREFIANKLRPVYMSEVRKALFV